MAVPLACYPIGVAPVTRITWATVIGPPMAHTLALYTSADSRATRPLVEKRCCPAPVKSDYTPAGA